MLIYVQLSLLLFMRSHWLYCYALELLLTSKKTATVELIIQEPTSQIVE